MKVMQINCVYKNGSTGKITNDIHEELLTRGIDSVVCYGRGTKDHEEYVYKTCGELYSKANHFVSMITGIMYGGCQYSTWHLISIIKKEKPDIVHLQCINGYFVNIYSLINWLKSNHIKTVLTLHAEFMYTGGCGYALECEQWSSSTGCNKCPRWRSETKSIFYDRTSVMWKRMKGAFSGFNEGLIIASVSPWLMERAKRAPIFADKEHRIVLNGLDTDVFHFYDGEKLKKKHRIKNEKVLLHVTPAFNLLPNHIKGGFYIAELAKMFLGENVKIFVVGSHEKGIHVPDNIVFLGKITNQNILAQYYSMADVTVLTSKKETFSMITAESLCCGTPIVGFKAGAPEQIAMKEYSRFVRFGEMDGLKESVMEILSRKIDKRGLSIQAIAKYGKELMCERYIAIYKELCGK